EALAETNVRQRRKSHNNVPQRRGLLCRDFSRLRDDHLCDILAAMKKKTLTTAKSKRQPATKNAKRAKKPRVIGITKPYGFLIMEDGTLETKEAREKRLARLEALTMRAFRMAAEDYRSK
ncbi:MAG TPA: hypothetical protein VFR12_12960, partial [Pyrinomonadaceae bacterium]|nr:hypothetical protein [Pyrinomonadaceae bacterium]